VEWGLNYLNSKKKNYYQKNRKRGIVKKRVLILVVIVLGLIVVIGAGGYLWLQHRLIKSLPQISGEIAVQGLRSRVEIIRDFYGVPHIYAANEPDLFFAMGYAMAQDRLWQMEFFRRLGQGRLSEIFGEDFVQVDRYFRMITAGSVNQKIPDELAFIPQSFAEGVNAYIETHIDRLPFEFTVLRYKPDPWAVDDYLTIIKVINWALSVGWKVDLTAARILEKVGEKRLREAFPAWPDDAPLIIPTGGKALSVSSNPTLETISVVDRLITLPAAAASNNWAIAGERSATGKPILANDPHLELTNPSVWWAVHLACPTLNASGFALPGTPGIGIGHNRRVAWGVTNVMVDDVDFYIERIKPENPRQYWYMDHWEPMRVVEETIQVKGGDHVSTEILVTRHGQIVNELEEGAPERPLAARWAFTEGLQPIKAGYLLLKARDILEVKEALRYWELPSQNLVFADAEGNIGYWCCATVPIRPKGDGILPMPGWSDEYEWRGYVPFDERPHLINPQEGFVATANNKIVGESYPYMISHYWEPPDRITRIRQLLTTSQKLSIEDCKRMQQDIYCVLASEITPQIIRVLEDQSSDTEATQAKTMLSQWDFRMAKDSAGACLFEVTVRKMMENIFKDELGEELFEEYLQTFMFPPRAIRMMIKKGSSPWFDDVTTPEKEAMEDIVARSLGQALAELKGIMGSDMTKWQWGRIHTLTFEHVLGKKKPLDRIFNLGPFPVGGSHLTINNKQYPYDKPYQANLGASARLIVDLSNMDDSLHCLPTGESGNLGSPHYRDQIDLYLNGEYHPAWTDRKGLEKHSEGTLILKPKL
jgi:penicillin amidase